MKIFLDVTSSPCSSFYQAYRVAYMHSFLLIRLTVFDLIVAFLIRHEYRFRKLIAAQHRQVWRRSF